MEDQHTKDCGINGGDINGIYLNGKALNGTEISGGEKKPSAECASSINASAHRADMTDTQIYEYYSNWARKGTYDVHLGPENYKGPEICANFLAKYVKNKSAPILDVAAGTGRLGMELKKKGYLKLDALEPAEGMLETSKKRNIYRNHYHIPFNSNNPDVPSDAYEALGIAGGMGQGHIKCGALPEMARCVRKGGIITIVMREAYLQEVEEYRDRLEPKMAAMETEGLWRRLERTVVPKYSFNNNGVVFVFEVLQEEQPE